MSPGVAFFNLIDLYNMAVLASQGPTTWSPTTLLAEQAAEPGKLGLSLIMQAYNWLLPMHTNVDILLPQEYEMSI